MTRPIPPHEQGAALINVLVLVGVLDDRFDLRGRHKLIGQMMAVEGFVVCSAIGLFNQTEVSWRVFKLT
jgi:UDP-N-acetylmuramyl pentapeptide phosphotransferase/UDP-N-acetylglucosamine-1-phosphate transferase